MTAPTQADLIVLGAGPAGANAALSAAGAGLSVVLFDEQEDAGGQVWRAPRIGTAALATAAGEDLRARIAGSAVDFRPGRRIWSAGGTFRVDAIGPGGPEAVSAPRLVAATGAHERVVPFPGWTLPGVIGLAAATALLKSQGMVPGRRVVVAGCGPLLAAVAAGIVAKGGEVAAVVDLSGPLDWLAAARGFAARPDLLAEGLGWVLRIVGRRVPVLFHHGVRRSVGRNELEEVVLGPVGHDRAPSPGPERIVAADVLCVGHGLVPGAEVTRLFRARHRYDRLLGGWIPELDPVGRTTVTGLYAAGDGAGIRGAAPAVAAGTLAGLAVARDAGVLSSDDFDAAVRRSREGAGRLAAFAAASARLMALRPAQVAAIPPETVVCRCEDVTRAEIDAAAEDGATEVNQLKHFTRCGMGPCQGRMCGDVAAELLAARAGGREAVGWWTARPPLRPVPIGDLIGDFDYDDIPIPAPAPL